MFQVGQAGQWLLVEKVKNPGVQCVMWKAAEILNTY